MQSTTKEYIRPMPALWFLHNRHVCLFMLRELTSFFVAGYAVFLLVVLYRFGQGTEAFHRFYSEVLCCPWALGLQIVALIFVIYHGVTSFNAAPVIMPVRIGEDKVSPVLIVGANYLLWLVATVAVLWFAL